MSSARVRILGVNFYDGTALTAVEKVNSSGGCVVILASPALTKLNYDEAYRAALQQADVVLPDSELLILLWRLATGRQLQKISGIDYLTALLETASFREDQNALWVVHSDAAKEKAVAWLSAKGRAVDAQTFRVLLPQTAPSEHHALLFEIEKERPRHIVIALRGGGQEQLGIYLRDYLLYRPCIHCVGAALGFLTGDERRIPGWLQRHRLGWLARLAAQPRMLLPRIAIALALAWMVFRYRAEMPPLRTRWTDM